MPHPDLESEGLVWFRMPEPQAMDDGPPHVDDIQDWLDAESSMSGAMQKVQRRLGYLDMLTGAESGQWTRRAAISTASRLSHLLAHPVSSMEIGLWRAMYADARDEEKARALAQAGWAADRLSGRLSARGRPDPARPETIMAFLERHAVDENPILERFGRDFAGTSMLVQLQNWSILMEHGRVLSPMARAAFAFHSWRACRLARRHPAGLFEALVLTARLELDDGGLPFLTLSPNAIVDGTVQQRLAGFVSDVGQCALNLRRDIENMMAWRDRAMELVTPQRARLKGVITAFLDHDPVSVALVMQESGISRVNANRHLRRLEEAGLIRSPGHPARTRLYTACH